MAELTMMLFEEGFENNILCRTTNEWCQNGIICVFKGKSFLENWKD